MSIKLLGRALPLARYFLANAAQAFETGTTNRNEERRLAENQKLKQAVGELTLVLKNDW